MEVPIEFVPLECGEWTGELCLTTSWVGRGAQDIVEECQVPTYMRVLQPSASASALAAALPAYAPRPFKPGGACRITLDAASISQRQCRPPSSVRSGSRAGSTRPGSAASTAGGFRGSSPGLSPRGHLASGRSSARSQLRPSSGGLRGIQLAQEAQRQATQAALLALDAATTSPPTSPREATAPLAAAGLAALEMSGGAGNSDAGVQSNPRGASTAQANRLHLTAGSKNWEPPPLPATIRQVRPESRAASAEPDCSILPSVVVAAG